MSFKRGCTLKLPPGLNPATMTPDSIQEGWLSGPASAQQGSHRGTWSGLARIVKVWTLQNMWLAWPQAAPEVTKVTGSNKKFCWEHMASSRLDRGLAGPGQELPAPSPRLHSGPCCCCTCCALSGPAGTAGQPRWSLGEEGRPTFRARWVGVGKPLWISPELQAEASRTSKGCDVAAVTL